MENIDEKNSTTLLETNTSTEAGRAAVGRAMEGITLLNVNKRIYRIPTNTLPKDFVIKNQNELILKVADNKEIALLQRGFFSKGKGGKTLNSIQRETSTRIHCSRDVIEIRGTQKAIELAKSRIDEIVNASSNKIKATHFLSLPITDSHILRKVETFHSDVLSLSVPGIEPSILNNPSSLHITLGLLVLPRQEDVEGATRLLKELSSEIYDLVGTRTLLVQLAGLNTFDNPASASVLYSKVTEPEGQEVLEKLVEFLHERFSKSRYLKKENRPVKFHVTLINTKYRGREDATTTTTPNQGDRNKHSIPSRISFSAELFLNKFADINFGTCRIESLHINKMGERDPEGKYISAGKINLP
ncbi:5262_t:CDS:2 [Ambispora gerdemannii]|uniref:5262_t:CDS:1 n=1 Tax=Ambispora gerdemannii TaxID=144530 RepID=A0A9N8YP12_9GLOM|nr:5262_t:CDS:2 [Ambispora gerdemannii]